MTIKIKSFLLIFAIILLGCKDEFLLETTNYKPIMVVDGIITNEVGPYTIKLSLDSPLSLEEEVHLEGCTVSLYENTGKSEVLKETEPGKYMTSKGGIQGIVGNNYSISIITPDGKEYKTEPQEMKEPIEVDSLYAELSYHKEEDYPFGLPGYQFYINTKIASSHENYILWRMNETYQYMADYPLYGIWVRGELLIGVPVFSHVYRCWKTQSVGYLFTGNTSNLVIPKIFKQPLHFVGTDSRRLQERYSLLLKQYSIGEEAYHFWKSIEDQISQENFLEANQPFNVTGNVKNIMNPDESVYGYFTVASAIQKRIFVNRPRTAFYYETCLVDLVPPYTSNYMVMSADGLGSARESCLDCTSKGGEAFKPDFWIDK